MALGHHAEESVNSLWYLVFGSRDCHYVACLFSAWKVDFAVPFLFQLFNLCKSSNEFSMVESVDDDGFRYKFGILRS